LTADNCRDRDVKAKAKTVAREAVDILQSEIRRTGREDLKGTLDLAQNELRHLL